MVIEMFINDELWDTEPQLLPKSSRLFHLEPMGLRTCYVESLTSYVARLAEAHSVPTGTLLAIEVKPMVKDIRDENPLNYHSIVTLYGQASIRALNGTQNGAKKLVKALSKLTLRDDLPFLTLLPWAEVLPVLGLLRPSMAWCPYCYLEWLNNKQIIYSPLLWALQVVKICPYHYQPLESQCPHCHQEFLPLWRNSRPGFCLKCGGWLGTPCELSSEKKNLLAQTNKLHQELWIVQTLGDLIAQAMTFSKPPPRETIKTVLNAYVDEYTNGNVSAFGRCLGLSRHEILHWCSGASIPNLDKLLKICYILETSLVDFLQIKVVPLSANKLAFLSISELFYL